MTARLLIVFVVLLAACGGEPTACEDVADEGIALIQDLLDDLESGAGTDQPSLVDEFDARAVELNNRADAAGCSPTEMAELLEDRAGDLDASTDEGRAFIDLIRAGVVFSE